MKFELLAGTHSNKTGIYKKGDIVDSSFELDKVFANKFQRRKDLEAPAKAEVVSPKAPTTQAPPAPSTPANDDGKADDAGGAQGDETEQDSGKPADNDKKVSSKLGEDVTASFPTAKEADFLVFKNKDGKFNVADPEKKDKALNKRPLGADDVEGFIKQYLG